jgi:hypothetical protein
VTLPFKSAVESLFKYEFNEQSVYDWHPDDIGLKSVAGS